jgi:hypothetical protein
VIKEGLYSHLSLSSWSGSAGIVLLDAIEHLDTSSCDITSGNACVVKQSWVSCS